jgi:acetylserotonin O-methyltransferase
VMEERATPDPVPNPAPVLALLDGFRSSKAMFVAVSLKVFDSLERQPASAGKLATELHVLAEPLERLLDACVGLGLARKDNGVYQNQPVASAYLCRGTPTTLAGYVLYSDKILFALWGYLESAIQRGEPQWTNAFHVEGGIFDHFFRTAEDTQNFLEGMHGLGVLSSPRIVSAFDLSRFQTFVDLGGATGHLAIAACERYPGMRAILFDLPRVIDAVQQQIAASPAGQSIECRKGDFFSGEELPEADLFGLGKILHDWPDEKASKLLQAIHAHLPSGGGILLAEKLLREDKSGPLDAQLQSLNMLVCTEGRERTLGEFRALLESAGFVEVRGHITGAPLDAVFAVKP